MAGNFKISFKTNKSVHVKQKRPKWQKERGIRVFKVSATLPFIFTPPREGEKRENERREKRWELLGVLDQEVKISLKGEKLNFFSIVS